MKTSAITFLLTTPAPEREVERFAAELAEGARTHLRPGEELALAGVEGILGKTQDDGA
jgi:hypothetical protein